MSLDRLINILVTVTLIEMMGSDRAAGTQEQLRLVATRPPSAQVAP